MVNERMRPCSRPAVAPPGPAGEHDVVLPGGLGALEGEASHAAGEAGGDRHLLGGHEPLAQRGVLRRIEALPWVGFSSRSS